MPPEERFVERLIRDLDLEAELKDQKNVFEMRQLNLRLSAYTLRLLDQLADNLEVSRTSLAADLLAASIAEASSLRNLPTDLTPDEHKAAAAVLRERGLSVLG